MNRNELFEAVKTILAEYCSYKGEITLDTELDEDLNIWGMDVYLFVDKLEECLGLWIDQDEVMGWVTVEDVVNSIERCEQ